MAILYNGFDIKTLNHSKFTGNLLTGSNLYFIMGCSGFFINKIKAAMQTIATFTGYFCKLDT